MSFTLFALSQIMQVAPPGPIDMEPVPGVSWTCGFENEQTFFALKGTTPDFARNATITTQPSDIGRNTFQPIRIS